MTTLPIGIWGGQTVLERWHHATSDEISRSRIDTQKILLRYELSQDAREVRQWLFHGPTEAPNAEMRLVRGEWAIEHQQGFVAILTSLSSKERDLFVDLFYGDLDQYSIRKFALTFADNPSPSIRKILSFLK